jgi:hypothetical protein
MQLKELAGDHSQTAGSLAGSSSTTDTETTGSFVVPFNAVITGGKWVPSAAVTANATNYFTVFVRNRTASGTVRPLSRSYAATNSTAYTADAMALSGTASDLQVNAGDVLTVEMIHTGTGLTLPAGAVQIYYRAR